MSGSKKKALIFKWATETGPLKSLLLVFAFLCLMNGCRPSSAEPPASLNCRETYGDEPFEEDHWVGKVMVFGENAEGGAVSITLRDKRCAMINFDPETAKADPSILKSVVRLNQNNAGVYGAVVGTGNLSVGQKIYLKSL